MADQYIKHDQDDYAEVISELRPEGPAWPRDPESVQMKTIDGLAGPWGNEVSDAADDFLVTESFPPTSNKLLPEWEKSLGLPDLCLPIPATLDTRHAAIVHRMTLQGGPSRAFFIAEALYQGYEITIQEFSPYMCGYSQVGWCGGKLNPDDPSHAWWCLGAAQIRYYWVVYVANIAASSALQCLFDRYKPSHTVVLFSFTNALSATSISVQPASVGQPVPIAVASQQVLTAQSLATGQIHFEPILNYSLTANNIATGPAHFK